MIFFDVELRKALVSGDIDIRPAHRRRMLEILDRPVSNPRRQRVIVRWEQATRHHLVATGAAASFTATIDWSSIDWAAILKLLLEIFLMFL